MRPAPLTRPWHEHLRRARAPRRGAAPVPHAVLLTIAVRLECQDKDTTFFGVIIDLLAHESRADGHRATGHRATGYRAQGTGLEGTGLLGTVG